MFSGLCFSILLVGLVASIIATLLPTIVADLKSGAMGCERLLFDYGGSPTAVRAGFGYLWQTYSFDTVNCYVYVGQWSMQRHE